MSTPTWTSVRVQREPVPDALVYSRYSPRVRPRWMRPLAGLGSSGLRA